MKALSIYIKEELDIDNINWKVKTYFNSYPKELEMFLNIANSFKATRYVDIKILTQMIDLYKFNVKPLIDFLDDTIVNNTDIVKDYPYQLKKVIELLLNNKTSIIYENPE